MGLFQHDVHVLFEFLFMVFLFGFFAVKRRSYRPFFAHLHGRARPIEFGTIATRYDVNVKRRVARIRKSVNDGRIIARFDVAEVVQFFIKSHHRHAARAVNLRGTADINDARICRNDGFWRRNACWFGFCRVFFRNGMLCAC